MLRPTLVLLPGMHGTGGMFGPLIEAVGDRLPVVWVDYPRDEPLGYAALAERVVAALPAGPCVVLGESFSGPVAVRVAAARPQQVVGLVLAASFVTRPVDGLLRWLAVGVGPLLMRLAPPRVLLRVAFSGGDDLLARWVGREIGWMRGAVAAHRLGALMAVDDRELLRAVGAPMLYLQATGDWLVSARASDEAVAAGRATRVRIEGPHLVLQRAPKVCADAVVAFVQGGAG